MATSNEKTDPAEIVLDPSPSSTMPVAGEVKPDQAAAMKPLDTPSPSALPSSVPPIDAPSAMIDNQPQALPPETVVEPSAAELELRNTEAEAHGEIKPDRTAPADPVNEPPPVVSPFDTADARVDDQPQVLPNTTLTEPPDSEPVRLDANTQNDPRAIIDFVIRKRSRQTDDQ
jgi:hypothetical protein